MSADEPTALCAEDRAAWDAAATNEQRDMCATCPILTTCQGWARDELQRITSATLHAWDGGVWAGRTLVEWRSAAPKPRRRSHIAGEVAREARALAAHGLSTRAIADRLGITYQTAYRAATGATTREDNAS